MGKSALLVFSGLLFFAFVLGVSAQTPGLDPLPPEVESCLREAVGDERFDAISSGQSQPTPEEMSLGQQCFQAFSDSVPPPEVIGMTPELIDCLKSVIGEERFNAISSGQSQPTPEEMRLGQQCFEGYTSVAEGAPPPGVAQPRMDPWLEACLREAVGDERFDAISSGQSQPTDVEEQKGIACFARLGHERPTIVSAPDHAFEVEVLQCLKLALGEERFRAIAEGSASLTLADRQKAEKCFGSTPAPISPPPNVVLDEPLIACLKAAVGEERFQAIQSGESLPTPEERAKGEACFGASQPADGLSPDVILPLPADQVPYLPENPDAVSVDDVSPVDEGDSEGTPPSGDIETVTPEATPSSEDTETVTLEGTAPPGEIVDVYIHSSTAIVASTEADSSGRWSYTVLGLEKGSHLAYATAKVGGETERSAGAAFEVGGGAAGSAPAEPPVTSSQGTNWALWGLVSGAAAALVVIAAGASYRLGRKRIRSK